MCSDVISTMNFSVHSQMELVLVNLKCRLRSDSQLWRLIEFVQLPSLLVIDQMDESNACEKHKVACLKKNNPCEMIKSQSL